MIKAENGHMIDPDKHSYKDGERKGVKLKKFQRMLIKNHTMSGTDIAMKVYNCKDRSVAAQISHQNLKKLNFTMKDVLERAGLTDEQDAEDLKRLRSAKETKFFQFKGEVVDQEEVEALDIQLKALELTQKLKGNLKDGSISFNTNVLMNLQEINIDASREVGDIIKDYTNRLSQGIKGESKV